ncbi:MULTISPECIES: energy-coupled thiamine transporter ThiT [Aerococcus]|uniref:ECF transporter S component n=1 Tax=Aerococcus sanguinicola TaxID=119206 RepID=A0A5N1GIJ1_9LACT|nr:MULTISPECIES: energy-coupled thiamine transporter ThiT [Aerococcus]KAA9300787.1 hypothetical protein F6I03_05635 [Aerococcus sanguinicola]MDK6369427.1 energy-coupled thiamine transporter ThiT [Aerococcus sp. UMB9870]MDK6686710.1 energy-coupled thiamine transporter ThiT [Aerococcus sp. UMB8623]OFK15356.1 hypothetical protein HMPREF2829_09010 [Aerococcus sp. HMSC072A12]OFR31837.1 hypothetical protein HMPREF2892_09245 [Aerococcus sp. HMSC061A03]
MQASQRFMTIIEGFLLALLAGLLQLVFPAELGETGLSLEMGLVLILFYAFRRGPLPACLAGALVGLIQLYQVPDALTNWPHSLALVLASAAVGLAGLFARNLQRTLHNRRMSSVYLNLVTGSFIGVLCYFICRFIDQALVQGAALAEAFRSNGLSFLLNLGIALAILVVTLNVSAKYFIPRYTKYISRKERSRLLND